MNLEGTSPDVPKFFGRAETRPSKQLLAIRYSPFTFHH